MSFDRIARHYRWLETITFGNALQRARTFWIDKIPPPQRVLIVGEGNGRFLGELMNVHRAIDIDCLDASGQMLRLARRRVLQEHTDATEHVRFLLEDINSWSPPDQPYDVIVTHFFLDCFPRDEVERIVAKLSCSSSANAIWLLADFALPETRFARWCAKFLLAAMYLFFRIAAGIRARKLVDATPFLEASGFGCTGRELSRGGMLKSECWRRS